MRTVIWIIVGLFMLAAVFFLVGTRPSEVDLRNKPQLTAEDIKRTADRFLTEADENEASLKQLKADLKHARKLNVENKKKACELDSSVGRIRDLAHQLSAQTGESAITAKSELRNERRRLDRLKRELRQVLTEVPPTTREPVTTDNRAVPAPRENPPSGVSSSGTYTTYTSSKKCSACGREVPLDCRAGQRCPHCGVYRSAERTVGPFGVPAYSPGLPYGTGRR